jgi:N-methylhydantoinase B
VEPVWQILKDNIRASHMVVGDMEAQIAACRIGAERMADLAGATAWRRCARPANR